MKEQKELLRKICSEHASLSEVNDRHVFYFWFTQSSKGPRSFNYKPFMVLAEINLLHEMKIIDDSEKEGIIRLFESSNYSDDLYMAMTSLEFFRNQRIEKFGTYKTSPENYKELSINYKEKVFTVPVMLSYITTAK
jgi:hypothetical protein